MCKELFAIIYKRRPQTGAEATRCSVV